MNHEKYPIVQSSDFTEQVGEDQNIEGEQGQVSVKVPRVVKKDKFTYFVCNIKLPTDCNSCHEGEYLDAVTPVQLTN